jgi:hypothetical protein
MLRQFRPSLDNGLQIRMFLQAKRHTVRHVVFICFYKFIIYNVLQFLVGGLSIRRLRVRGTSWLFQLADKAVFKPILGKYREVSEVNSAILIKVAYERLRHALQPVLAE